ncbi:hypothetical protein [Marinobacter sp.]|uniref:hypothetical protein n=1 Tax=Marinobacter sp. TaxID=50741 RepID=UPI00384C5134
MTTDFHDGALAGSAANTDPEALPSGYSSHLSGTGHARESSANRSREQATGHADNPNSEPSVAAYWAARRRYLDSIRKVPELRQRFISALGIYILRRALWSFGFFPVVIAFWVPLVLSSFNPVILVGDVLPTLQAFVNANPEVQANTISTLVIAWLSLGFFFLVFDFVLTPFRSPYQYEADVHMRAWEQRNHDELPDKV